MRIRDCMSCAVVTIAPEESVALAARLLARHDLGALPVCGHRGKLLGMVTDRDIVTRCIAAGQDPARVPVSDIMSRHPAVVHGDGDLREAAARMSARQVRRLPVVEEDGRLAGILSLNDLARSRRVDMEAAAALCGISRNVRRAAKG